MYQPLTSLTVESDVVLQDKTLQTTMLHLERQPETPSNPVRHLVQPEVTKGIEWA